MLQVGMMYGVRKSALKTASLTKWFVGRQLRVNRGTPF